MSVHVGVPAGAAGGVAGWSVERPRYDGRTIKAEGNSNQSYFNDPAINAEMDRVLAMAPAEQGPIVGSAQLIAARPGNDRGLDGGRSRRATSIQQADTAATVDAPGRGGRMVKVGASVSAFQR